LEKFITTKYKIRPRKTQGSIFLYKRKKKRGKKGKKNYIKKRRNIIISLDL